MATKSYSKHKEFKEYSSSGTVPYTGEQFDMLKTELLPKNKIKTNVAPGESEYFYEYKEEKHPTGKYDRKDLHTVEQFTVPSKPSSQEHSSYFYEREEKSLPAIETSYYNESSSSTPGYSKIKSSKVSKSKELSQNVEELDSLLDDLQRDQERQLYKNGYTSDTAESSSFDYRKSSTPVKAPSSGYSTMKTERLENSTWGRSPSPAPAPVPQVTRLEQQMFREEKTESRVVPSQISPAIPLSVPTALCSQCHPPNTGTLSRSSTPMNKVTTTVKTYTYEVPADQDPTTVPLPSVATEERRYLSANDTRSSSTTAVSPSPSLGCQYCSHCNSRIVREYTTVDAPRPAPVTTNLHSSSHRYESHIDEKIHPNSERIVYPNPKPSNEVRVPVNAEPHNGHGPYGPQTYKWSETSYSRYDTSERSPGSGPGHDHPGPFPRPTTPSPGVQQPPKRLDDLLADFPEARFPTSPDGITQRKVEMSHEMKSQNLKTPPPTSKNVSGPAVYYPPNNKPIAKSEGSAAYQAAGGGGHASGRGMYEYESGSKSKMKSSETKTAVPVCLPLCCAMPCVIM